MLTTLTFNVKTKAIIDAMSYKEMLKTYRFAEAGNPWFVGDVGTYFMTTMQRKKMALSESERVAISKAIGWGK